MNARLRKKQHSTVTEDYRDIQTVEDLVMPPHAPRVEPQPAGASAKQGAEDTAEDAVSEKP